MKPFLLIAIAAFFFSCNNETKNNNAAVNKDTATAPPPPAMMPSNIEMKPALDGTWELNYISGPKIDFEGLYPNKKPAMTFDVAAKKVSGNTGCNNFSGELKTEGFKLNFNQPMAITKMFCPGQGETVFLETLKKISSYSITDSTLTFIMDDIALMRFKRK